MCVYVGEGLRRSLATPDPFVLTNKICLNQLRTISTQLNAKFIVSKRYHGERKSIELFPVDKHFIDLKYRYKVDRGVTLITFSYLP